METKALVYNLYTLFSRNQKFNMKRPVYRLMNGLSAYKTALYYLVYTSYNKLRPASTRRRKNDSNAGMVAESSRLSNLS
jgi:hypothetical protein